MREHQSDAAMLEIAHSTFLPALLVKNMYIRINITCIQIYTWIYLYMVEHVLVRPQRILWGRFPGSLLVSSRFPAKYKHLPISKCRPEHSQRALNKPVYVTPRVRLPAVWRAANHLGCLHRRPKRFVIQVVVTHEPKDWEALLAYSM